MASSTRAAHRFHAPAGVVTAGALAPAAAAFGAFGELAERAADYGYWAVFLIVAGDGIFPALPGETAIVTAAVLAADARIDLWLVILAGAAGAVAGDSAAYWIGRAGGGPITRLVARAAGRRRLEAAQRMVHRQGAALVLAGRFLPGIRIAINLSCGAGGMRYWRFLCFDALGALLWSAQAALLGYFAGKAFAGQLWVAFVVALGVTAAVGAAVAVKERRRVAGEVAAAAREVGPGGASPSPGHADPPV